MKTDRWDFPPPVQTGLHDKEGKAMHDTKSIREQLKTAVVREHQEKVQVAEHPILRAVMPFILKTDENWYSIYVVREKNTINVWFNGPRHGDVSLNHLITKQFRKDWWEANHPIQYLNWHTYYNPNHMLKLTPHKVAIDFDNSQTGWVTHIRRGKVTVIVSCDDLSRYKDIRTEQEIAESLVSTAYLEGDGDGICGLYYAPFRSLYMPKGYQAISSQKDYEAGLKVMYAAEHEHK